LKLAFGAQIVFWPARKSSQVVFVGYLQEKLANL
jgi:hypothetical protein